MFLYKTKIFIISARMTVMEMESAYLANVFAWMASAANRVKNKLAQTIALETECVYQTDFASAKMVLQVIN